ncbi:uncharacterized protein [Rutidosis leptorrhynchoides]|uniref:uncharacterized protein n=1 Tax=Rutidosis leptorrhynchoides TaxID=125765 RepID=UPI003A991A7B
MRSCPSSLGAARSRRGRDFRVRIRVGSWNVGSLTSKSRELVETLLKSKVDILCVQETRWKGEEAVDIGDYKLWFSGSRVARNGVGIFIGPRHKDNIVGVGRCSDRIMSVRLVIQEESYMVICAYAPHAGLGEEEKSRFWESLDEVVRSCPADHRLLIGGDLNGHIGTISDGYAGVHGGFGYGVRNEEGRSILEFAVAHDLVVANSFFRKTEAHLATFHSGGHSTQIDYLLLRKGDLRTCRDCKALTTWTCSTQHRLLVMDLVPQRRVTRRGRPTQPRILWKNLNEEKAETFKASVLERVEAVMDTVTHGDADQMWNSFASTIRDVAKETLGVAVGTSRGHKSCRESWWISDEVQTKVALKQLRFRELVTCRDGTRDDRTRAEERKLDSKEGANDIYRIAKARERRRRDIDNIKFIKDEAGQTIVKEDEIRKRWEGYFQSLFVGEGPGRQEDPQDLGIGHFQNNNFCRRISQEEVRSALRKMGRNKAVGPDQIPIEAWRCLGEDGARYIRAIMDMYDGAKACVRTPVGNTEYFPIEVGLHQGSTLSPFLFALILDELYRGIQENIPWCLIFADDIVLVSETKDELNRRLEQWREALEQNGLRISRQKTEYLSCEFGRTDDELNKKVDETVECLLQYPSFEEAIAIPWRSLPKRVAKLYFAMRGTPNCSDFFF